jgi:hypothetical protein
VPDFEVIHRKREADGSYLFEIRQDGRKVAEIKHNHRGEDHYIRRSSLRAWEEFDDVLEGGGPEPLRLGKAGRDLLIRYLAANPPA